MAVCRYRDVSPNLRRHIIPLALAVGRHRQAGVTGKGLGGLGKGTLPKSKIVRRGRQATSEITMWQCRQKIRRRHRLRCWHEAACKRPGACQIENTTSPAIGSGFLRDLGCLQRRKRYRRRYLPVYAMKKVSPANRHKLFLFMNWTILDSNQ